MDAVDEVLLTTLRSINCGVPDDVTSVDQMSPADVFAVIVRCLWTIDPDTEKSLPHAILPAKMASRFRAAGDVATGIKQLGYRSELGYQSLLYGSAAEHRRLLLFLSDRLPKAAHDAADAGHHKSPLDRALIAAGARVRHQLAVPWTPWYCARMRFVWRRGHWHPPNDATEPEADALSRAETVPFCASDVDGAPLGLHWRNVPASVLAACEARQSAALEPSTTVGTASQSEPAGSSHVSAVGYGELQRSRPALPPKPKVPPKPVDTGTASVGVSGASVAHGETVGDGPSDAVDMQRGQLEQTLGELRVELGHLRRAAQTERVERVALECELQSRQHEWDTVGARLTALLDLPGGEAVDKLKAFVSQGDSRMQRLEQQFSDGRRQMVESLEQARDRRANTEVDERSRLVTLCDESKKRSAQIHTELQLKDNFVQQLEKERAKMAKGAARSAYTKRIMEMIGSVNKQRELIDKTVVDNLVIQKEIKMLTGKLDRTFVAAQMEFREGAAADATLGKSIALLGRIHDTFARSLAAIEATGVVQRHIEELHNQVETEGQKSAASNLEQLVTDYCEMKMENEALEAKLRKAGALCDKCAARAQP